MPPATMGTEWSCGEWEFHPGWSVMNPLPLWGQWFCTDASGPVFSHGSRFFVSILYSGPFKRCFSLTLTMGSPFVALRWNLSIVP